MTILVGFGIVGVGTAVWFSKASQSPNPLARTGSSESVSSHRVECGHWSALRTCELLGVPVELHELTRRLPDSKSGHSLLQISNVLREVGFEVEGRQETMDTLRRGRFPFIAYLDRPEPHFAVVSEISDGSVHLFDCEGRRSSWSEERFEERWSGKLLRVRRRDPDDVLPAFGPKVADGAPRIQFETLFVDKGNVAMTGDALEYAFPFRNHGQGVLQVKNVVASCDCMEIKKPNMPIGPGESGQIGILIDPQSKRGPFVREAVVATNDPFVPFVTLKVGGYVDARVTIDPKELSIKRTTIPGSAIRRVCFVKYSGDRSDFRVLGANCTIPGASVQVYPTDGQELTEWLPAGTKVVEYSKNVWAVEVSVVPDSSEVGETRGNVAITTNIPGFERITMPIRCEPEAVKPSIPLVVTPLR